MSTTREQLNSSISATGMGAHKRSQASLTLANCMSQYPVLYTNMKHQYTYYVRTAVHMHVLQSCTLKPEIQWRAQRAKEKLPLVKSL